MNTMFFLSDALVEAGNNVYEVLLALVILVLVGLFGGRVFEAFNIPRITGHLVAGIMIGPSVIGIVTHESIIGLEIITNIALGFIAYGIGSEISFKHLKNAGKQLIVITFMQALLAVLLVVVLLLIVGAPIWLALTLGAIATATAPGPIMMITKQYRSKGPVTETLVPLVGLDDAIGVVMFGIMLSIANSYLKGTVTDFVSLVTSPMMEILLSVVVGGIIGWVMMALVQLDKSESRDYNLIINISGVTLAVALANIGFQGHHLSIVLTPMMAGMIYSNFIESSKHLRTIQVLDAFEPFILVAFFTIAGAHLDLAMIANTEDITVVMYGLIYLVARAVGKVAGTYFGATITHAHPNVKKWLGVALLPQAGVAIGMANAADTTLGGEHGLMVLTISLAAVVIYELFGPSGVRLALIKSGEIELKQKAD